MTRTPDASAEDTLRQQLLALLASGDVDAALQAGLMDFRARQDDGDAPLRHAQARLRNAWEARARYRAREARLARIAGEREARRQPTASPPGKPAAPADARPAAPALPAAAAAALARARAKASGGRPA